MPVPKKERRERLAALQGETRTILLYEAPHKLRGTLDDLAGAFGPERPVSLCRELTKLHEEIVKTTLGEAVAYYKENDPRGEYVLVVAGADPAAAGSGSRTHQRGCGRRCQNPAGGGHAAFGSSQTGCRRDPLLQRGNL